MIKAVIFDCFGVLITDALQAIVDEIQSEDPEKAGRIIGFVSAAMAGQMDPATSRTAVASELGISLEQYAEKIKNAEVKNKPLLSMIQTLGTQYKVGLLSNVLAGGLRLRFTEEELALFNVVAASGEIGYVKPDVQAYEYVADHLDVRLDECVMVDDRQDYCEGAEQAGMKAVRYESFDQMRHELKALLG